MAITANTKCAVCGLHPTTPYREIVNGDVVAGCISAAHTLHIDPDDAWHNREVAVDERRWFFANCDGYHAFTYEEA